MSTTTKKAPESNLKQLTGFVRIPVSAIRHNLVANVDLYVASRHRNTPTLYRSGNYQVSPSDFDELERRGCKGLFVTEASFTGIEKELFDSLEEVVANDAIQPTDRFALLQLAVSMEVDMAFRLIKCNRLVSLSSRIANNISQLLDESQMLPRGLFDVAQHDFYTFTHITNVAGFASLLAERIGISDREDRRLITEAALLHDIGKRFIPNHVITKPGALDQNERELIETHSLRGFVELRENSDMTFEQLLMVYQHHERVDGKGYPVGLVRDEIHPWARLLAVVDVFDAITSNRPYREPMSLSEAIEFLNTRSGTHFDEEMVRCWTSAIREK